MFFYYNDDDDNGFVFDIADYDDEQQFKKQQFGTQKKSKQQQLFSSFFSLFCHIFNSFSNVKLKQKKQKTENRKTEIIKSWKRIIIKTKKKCGSSSSLTHSFEWFGWLNEKIEMEKIQGKLHTRTHTLLMFWVNVMFIYFFSMNKNAPILWIDQKKMPQNIVYLYTHTHTDNHLRFKFLFLFDWALIFDNQQTTTKKNHHHQPTANKVFFSFLFFSHFMMTYPLFFFIIYFRRYHQSSKCFFFHFISVTFDNYFVSSF